MIGHKPQILVVDDLPYRSERYTEWLLEAGYALRFTRCSGAAWRQLERCADQFDLLIISCSTLPDYDSGLLARIQGHPEMGHIPVILLTPADSTHDMSSTQAIGGRCYHLEWPCRQRQLRRMVRMGVGDSRRRRRLQHQRRKTEQAFRMLSEGRFRVRSLAAARDLAALLASACPDPGRAALGLSELLVNAVEHGNLAISHAHKTRLLAERNWETEVHRRLTGPEHAGREVEVHFRRRETDIEVAIVDQGSGFDWRQYMDFAPARLHDAHGRGIAISRMLCFDHMQYRGCGNEVRVRIKLAQAA